MITLSILIFIIALYSTYRIHKICKFNMIPFNPFECDIMLYLGFVLGLTEVIGLILYFTIKYLP
jgi:hypothetical protein